MLASQGREQRSLVTARDRHADERRDHPDWGALTRRG
jgi:hypothetical protein